jgi:trichohyalin
LKSRKWPEKENKGDKMKKVLSLLTLLVFVLNAGAGYAEKGRGKGPDQKAYEHADEKAAFMRGEGWKQTRGKGENMSQDKKSGVAQKGPSEKAYEKADEMAAFKRGKDWKEERGKGNNMREEAKEQAEKKREEAKEQAEKKREEAKEQAEKKREEAKEQAEKKREEAKEQAEKSATDREKGNPGRGLKSSEEKNTPGNKGKGNKKWWKFWGE